MNKEIPILFSTPMVQAILAGRKTQTRRVVKPQPDFEQSFCICDNTVDPWRYQFAKGKLPKSNGPSSKPFLCRYGKPGDILYVRESWRTIGGYAEKPDYSVMSPKDFVYRAGEEWNGPWKPSLHMPKEAARIWLRVEDVRVERLQDISEEDARAEGVEVIANSIADTPIYRRYDKTASLFNGFASAENSFQSLWQSINGPESWDANPFVWVVSFTVLSTTGKPQNIKS